MPHHLGRLLVAALLSLLHLSPLQRTAAQSVDSTDTVREDSLWLSGEPDSVSVQSPTDTRPFALPESAPVAAGIGVDAGGWSGTRDPLVLPVVTPVLDASHVLANVPGTFLYDLGPSGWPHGWSPDGLDPASVGLTAMGLSWNDPISGRPRFDMLPIEFFQPLDLGADERGHAVGVEADLRPYDAPRPATELRYRKGPAGLQAIAATHAQRRQLTLLGGAGDLNVLAGYGGRASQGEYPGSRLRRERRVLGRVSFDRETWRIQLLDLHSRHQVGAHGGVLPQPGQGLESVYDRFGARVENERATRRTVRNDLVATIELPPLLPEFRPRIRAFWTAQSFRYRDVADTLSVDSDRIGAQFETALPVGVFSPDLVVSVESDRHALSWRDERVGRLMVHASGTDTLRLGPLLVSARAGLHKTHRTTSALAVGARFERGGAIIFAHVSRGVDEPALLQTHGLGGRVTASDRAFEVGTSVARLGARWNRGALSVGLTGFANRTSNELTLLPGGGDTLRVHALVEAVQRLGAVAELGLRAHARRGWYVSLSGTYVAASGGGEQFESDVAEALPTLFGTGRGGLRYVLFRGDLDLHVYLEARAWSVFRSRVLHPPTGLLVLPASDNPLVGPSSTLSLYVEAGVRDATIFVAWENLAAGTDLMDGTMLVPIYPLPERGFRFGVYWPILD